MSSGRMFGYSMVNEDDFLDLPATTRDLYFYLCIEADDFGFNNNPKKVSKSICSKPDDLTRLIDSGYVIEIGKKVVLITHWFQNNRLRPERMNTKFLRLLSYLDVVDPGIYVSKYPTYDFEDICQSTVIQLSDKFPLSDNNLPTNMAGFGRRFQENCDGKTQDRKELKHKSKDQVTKGGQMSAQFNSVDGSLDQSSLDEGSEDEIKPHPDVGNKLYGIFENVSLSTLEFEKIQKIGMIGYIDRASSWFKKMEKGICEFHTIINWISKDIGPDKNINNLDDGLDFESPTNSMTPEEIEELKLRLKRLGLSTGKN